MSPWARSRWITRDGKRVQHRDWMTDPADINTLLVLDFNEKLGINYRAVRRPTSSHFSFDPARAAGAAVCRAQRFPRWSDEVRKPGWPATCWTAG